MQSLYARLPIPIRKIVKLRPPYLGRLQSAQISDRNKDVTGDTRCPFASEQKVEAYLTGKLSEAHAQRFEDHYILCQDCTDLLESTDQFIRAVRAAGAILEGATPSRLGPQRANSSR